MALALCLRRALAATSTSATLLRLASTPSSVSLDFPIAPFVPTPLPGTAAVDPSLSPADLLVPTPLPRLPWLLPGTAAGFRSTEAAAAAARRRGGDYYADESEISPDEILFEGCDYNHWFITMGFPDPKPSREEMIETYLQTLAKVVGSYEEAKKRMCAFSTTTYIGFQAVMTEEMSEKFRGLPGVLFVVPDSYLYPETKEHGGDLRQKHLVRGLDYSLLNTRFPGARGIGIMGTPRGTVDRRWASFGTSPKTDERCGFWSCSPRGIRGIHTGVHYCPEFYSPSPPSQPLILQVSCPDPNDITLYQWEFLLDYFKQHDLVTDVTKSALGDFWGSQETRHVMLTPEARKFFKSSIDLIALNRRRGKCIAKELALGNLVVFKLYGTMGLTSTKCQNIEASKSSEFLGYLALKDLFVKTMQYILGDNWEDTITYDVILWIQSLEVAAQGSQQEELALNHGALLGPEGRHWLSIRIATILHCEMISPQDQATARRIYQQLGHLEVDLASKHSFFKEWDTFAA